MIENVIFSKRIEYVIADISNEFIFKTNIIDTRKNIFYIILHMSKKLVNNSNVKKKAILFEKLFKYVDIIYQNILLIYPRNLF